MTARLQRLAALAAVLSRERAASLLALLPPGEAAVATGLAAELAAAPRRARLAALAGALAEAEAEAPRSLGPPPGPPLHPLLARAWRERLARPEPGAGALPEPLPGPGPCELPPAGSRQAAGAARDATRTPVRAAAAQAPCAP